MIYTLRTPREKFRLTALLACGGEYAKDVRSNAEAGDSYADLMFTSGVGSRRIGVIIEIKRTNNNEHMGDFADQALSQIKSKRYTEYLEKLRCRKQFIYGIAFCRKDCEVVGEELSPTDKLKNKL